MFVSQPDREEALNELDYQFLRDARIINHHPTNGVERHLQLAS
jgi:hypothetical protein